MGGSHLFYLLTIDLQYTKEKCDSSNKHESIWEEMSQRPFSNKCSDRPNVGCNQCHTHLLDTSAMYIRPRLVDESGKPSHKMQRVKPLVSIDLSSGSASRRTTLESRLSSSKVRSLAIGRAKGLTTSNNSSAGSLAIDRASGATARDNSRAGQIRVSSGRAPDAEVDSLVLNLVDAGDFDTLRDRVSFTSLNLDLSTGVVEFSLTIVGTVDGDVFAADEVFAVGLRRHGTLA